MKKKKTKAWLLTAGALILLGILIFVGVLTVLKWDFSRLSTVKYETATHEVEEAVKSIVIRTNVAGIRILPAEDEACSVVCHEQKKVTHAVTAEDGTLTVSVTDTRKWYDYIGLHFGKPTVTVYLPAGEYTALTVVSKTGDVEIAKDFTFDSIDIAESTGDVTCLASAKGAVEIETTTGDILVESIQAEALSLSVSTGRITLRDVRCEGDAHVAVSTGEACVRDLTCQSFSSTGSTGKLSLVNVLAKNMLSAERSTGDVTLEACDAGELSIKTSTGNVRGTLLSDKVFLVSTDTGKKDVPATTAGGRCEIVTDTGDIKISLKQ